MLLRVVHDQKLDLETDDACNGDGLALIGPSDFARQMITGGVIAIAVILHDCRVKHAAS